ncbi:hypothetical protein [Mangrovicoccus algicola]|uniref:Uncharacterized protein n=1 Tax=Mangrovicoccus algicola TaxID=2771008 RepID=A0A8J6Z5U6_9RHOB|nr:hypothetical protein [Mangrovicoccus algicola]MBE3636986.1 hypothetical protein [Mangrovicoccus algicola]
MKGPGLALLLLVAAPGAAQQIDQRFNDYPTAARADYVFACMAANGQGRDVLERCSCSVDQIAAVLPYAKYVEAETVLSMRQVGGERMAVFRGTAVTDALVADLRRAQAEAEILCF